MSSVCAGSTCSTRLCSAWQLDTASSTARLVHATATLWVRTGAEEFRFSLTRFRVFQPAMLHAKCVDNGTALDIVSFGCAGIGADCCQNASVWVDASDPWGILISNGERAPVSRSNMETMASTRVCS